MSDRQYRPSFATLPINADRDLKQFHTEVQQAFRQTFDLVNTQMNSLSPTSLFTKGSGKTVPVPATNPGSGFGVAVTLSRPGSWVLTAAVALNLVGDANQPFTLSMVVGSVTEAQTAVVQQSADGKVMMHQSWQVSTPGGELCRLLIRKKAGSGTSNVDPANSTLTATWQGS